VLALYSARNRVHFDRGQIFRANPRLASTWYVRFAELLYSCVSSETAWEKLRRHFSFVPPQLMPVNNLQDVYFGSTYVDVVGDRAIKECVNRGIRALAGLPGPVRNTPIGGRLP